MNDREKGMWDGIRLACRAVCQWCYEDGPPKMNDYKTWKHKLNDSKNETCKASAILDAVRRTPPGTLGWPTEGEADEPRG